MDTVTINGKLPSGMTKKAVAKLALTTCDRIGRRDPGAITIRVSTDAEVRKLNRIHRHKDKVTDVLSFRYDQASGANAMPASVRRQAGNKGEQPLGDIVISLPQVRRQAKQIGRSTKAEFALMVVHGTLHLLGFDHETMADETKMFRFQHDILIQSGIF